MKNSEILTRARARFYDKSQGLYFICHAIDRVRAPYAQRRALRQWIIGLLEGHESLGVWLFYKHDVSTYTPRSIKIHSDMMRETRLAWLAWMIAYWKEQEKHDAQV